jgi:NCAIR mutase (PurE)-related protein
MPDPDDPLATLRAVMASLREDGDGRTDSGLRLDPGREARTGIPEIVYAPGKTTEQVIAATRGLTQRSGRAVVSRVDAAALDALTATFGSDSVRFSAGGRTVVVASPGYVRPARGGRIGMLTAGTSDFAAADEARVIAEEMGAEVRVVQDVGVAGIHRLFPPLADLFRWEADALIVAAGMDGALPSVVAGLSPVPVIGLPTPVGYGIGARGNAALHTMLQSCAPGLTVVNIDNGIGAGVAAARIANQSARAAQRIKHVNHQEHQEEKR